MRLALDLIVVGLGGAAGAALRYGVSSLAGRLFSGDAFVGTLCVNLIGCFAVGILWTVFDQRSVARWNSLLWLVGFVGSFTTFSTFAFEGFEMIADGNVRLGVGYVVGSNVVGILFVMLGIAAGQKLAG